MSILAVDTRVLAISDINWMYIGYEHCWNAFLNTFICGFDTVRPYSPNKYCNSDSASSRHIGVISSKLLSSLTISFFSLSRIPCLMGLVETIILTFGFSLDGSHDMKCALYSGPSLSTPSRNITTVTSSGTAPNSSPKNRCNSLKSYGSSEGRRPRACNSCRHTLIRICLISELFEV